MKDNFGSEISSIQVFSGSYINSCVSSCSCWHCKLVNRVPVITNIVCSDLFYEANSWT